MSSVQYIDMQAGIECSDIEEERIAMATDKRQGITTKWYDVPEQSLNALHNAPKIPDEY
jgi:hypothetical protein